MKEPRSLEAPLLGSEEPAMYATSGSPLLRTFSPRSIIHRRWRITLAIPWTKYAASCFAYTVVGIHSFALFYFCPQAIAAWPTEYALPESLLVIVQGFWSYASDVHAIGHTSYWHVVDRFSAQLLFLCQFVKYGLVLPDTLSYVEAIWLWLGLAIGVACKLMGHRCVVDGDALGYRDWHIAWHVSVPFAISVFQQARWMSCETCNWTRGY